MASPADPHVHRFERMNEGTICGPGRRDPRRFWCYLGCDWNRCEGCAPGPVACRCGAQPEPRANAS